MNQAQDSRQGKLILGIDLGTTNSGVAVWNEQDGQVKMLKTGDAGHDLVPSMVGWNHEQQTWVVGDVARDLTRQHTGQEPTSRVAYSTKRYIGRRFTDPGVLYGRKDLTYKLISGGGKDPLLDVVADLGSDQDGEPLRLTAPEVAAKVLLKLRKDAARALNMDLEELKHAVVTVPAYFNILQRKATLLAGRQAGLEEVILLNEPTAAALAYGDAVLSGQEKHILVYDLGGGTFDISLLEVSHDEVGYVFCTRVVDGDTFLGGDDIDAAVGRWLAVEIEKKHGQPVLPDDQITRERLRRAAERAKMDLSIQDVATVELEDLELGSRTVSDVRIELTRAQLEECAADVLERTRSITRRAVEDVAGLTWDQVAEVVLVGGQTLMPAIRRDVEKLTGLKPQVNDRPQLAVALGAGEYGRILSLGREKFHEKTVMNVIALPLGIRLDDNTFETIVQANVTVPHTSRSFPVTTTEDNQPQIHVEVLQGPRDATYADQCIVLGSIVMEVPSALARTPRFEVVFDVLSDGTMQVIVTDTRRQRQEVLDIVETRRVMAWRDSPDA